jgi:hypothetical protein
MTGRRNAHASTSHAPRAVTALTPDLNVCIFGYWLGRVVGQLVADVAGSSTATCKLVVASR